MVLLAVSVPSRTALRRIGYALFLDLTTFSLFLDTIKAYTNLIEAEHNQINGTPTTLTINLHHSKWSFHNGYKPFYTTTINYG
ncbi:hypothetical protein DXD67_02290 [Coprococcus comes]|uniref:Uncharacterized protein n=2 Tax=Lachnospiraceae TaxID=186803 RepID=A0A414A6J9_9FIRM|nr:hypothetical protein DXD67_02290 [Coprococcus comes]RGS09579.1 hypothetical protein DWY12_13515 [Enterocloster bolteae]RHC41342.1 hypothetical protein DW848_02540 [Agathobacter rectalis]RHM06886.1 hypothetical protein DWZ87_04190 [Roseburia intestinalis]